MAQPAPENFVVSDMERVKLYKLNEAGLWDDRGTGHVTVEFIEARISAQ